MDKKGDRKEERTFEEKACMFKLEENKAKFDLFAMEKEDGQYFSQGVGFNFCAYLPDSEYFASYSNLSGGLEILTSGEPTP